MLESESFLALTLIPYDEVNCGSFALVASWMDHFTVGHAEKLDGENYSFKMDSRLATGRIESKNVKRQMVNQYWEPLQYIFKDNFQRIFT